MCISKELGYRNNRGTWRRWCIPEFLLLRGVRLVGGVWVSNSRRHKWPHPILRWTLPKSSVHLPLLISFWAEIESLTTILRLNPQKDWVLPSDHKRSQLATKGLDHKRSQSPSRVQWPKSNKLTNFHFHESSWREQTDATKCNGKNTQSVQVLHSKIPTKQQMLMGE